MARRVFFSFHYERDSWRAGQVRNSWVTKDRESCGFWDAGAWEEVKKKTNDAIEQWIGQQLTGTSVTVVLIGAETSTREYVGYEIKQSHNRGNGMLGIYIHNIKDVNSRTDTKGANPLSNSAGNTSAVRYTLKRASGKPIRCSLCERTVAALTPPIGPCDASVRWHSD
jgi:MTH538 TIR-like domain (DUF1863)